jgi:hypothetical protein
VDGSRGGRHRNSNEEIRAGRHRTLVTGEHLARSPGLRSATRVTAPARRNGERAGAAIAIDDRRRLQLPPAVIPGPGDAAGWRAVLDRFPELQPALSEEEAESIFVEALMRWPTGLSSFERQETAWIRWWLLMPTFVSMLCSQKPERQMSLL